MLKKFFTPEAEMLNGRVAMVGWLLYTIGLLFT